MASPPVTTVKMSYDIQYSLIDDPTGPVNDSFVGEREETSPSLLNTSVEKLAFPGAKEPQGSPQENTYQHTKDPECQLANWLIDNLIDGMNQRRWYGDDKNDALRPVFDVEGFGDLVREFNESIERAKYEAAKKIFMLPSVKVWGSIKFAGNRGPCHSCRAVLDRLARTLPTVEIEVKYTGAVNTPVGRGLSGVYGYNVDVPERAPGGRWHVLYNKNGFRSDNEWLDKLRN
ncbi:hypothetical protein ACGFX8_37525 [Streptomyces sp. NPDC048362]|uniref:hypothetical protein n=1 Tax=Streptomyces sp. NPDC048362 TaxID=3365539 RepID=UPI003724BD2D